MSRVSLPSFGAFLQGAGVLLVMGALMVLIGPAWTALIGGVVMFVVGVFVESPSLVRLLGEFLVQRRVRPGGE